MRAMTAQKLMPTPLGTGWRIELGGLTTQCKPRTLTTGIAQLQPYLLLTIERHCHLV